MTDTVINKCVNEILFLYVEYHAIEFFLAKTLLHYYFILQNCSVLFFKSLLLKVHKKASSFICSLIPVCKVGCQPVLGLSLINKGITVT